MNKAFEQAFTIIAIMKNGGYNREGGGKVFDSAIGSNEAALAAVVGSGASNMNFTIVTMLFSAIDSNNTKIHITASAKETWISKRIQKSSQKAVKRMITAFL